MPQSDPDTSPSLQPFLRQLERDMAEGGPRSLEEYMRSFPEEGEAIAATYLRIKGDARQCHSAFDTRTGNALGQYRIERELGRGGQGEVYLAEDTRLQRKVALKVLRHLGPGSEETVRRFQREAELAARLNHPGICGVHDAGILDGTPYMAMPFVEGESLSAKIAQAREGGLGDVSLFLSFESESECGDGAAELQAEEDPRSAGPSDRASIMGVVSLIEKAARALHAAHEAGIVHRDIKPGNVMVTPAGEPVLLDFGLARENREDTQTLTLSGDFFGTPAYMPPEQIDGDMRDLDRRADVYSLGATLYECLALRRPFEEPTREALLFAIKTRDAPGLRRLNPAVTRDLATVTHKALQKNRGGRYETALEFAEELRRVRTFEPIRARPVTRLVRVKRWAQRNPGVAVSLSLFMTALIVGVAVSTIALLRSERNLEAWQQMADVRLIKDLELEAETDLWPARPENLPAIDRWLARTRKLLGRRAQHERTLAQIRDLALPYTQADRARDRATHPRAPELGELRSRLADVEDTRLRVRVAARIAELEDELATRRTWRFADPKLRYRHDVFADLCAGLERLIAEAGLRARVEGLRHFASTVHQRTIEDHARDWQEAISRVRRDHRFPGFRLEPQPGLVPLGPDPRSGLEEFGILELTGELPRRDAETGRLRIDESTGVVLVLIPGATFLMGAQSKDPDAPNHDPQAGRFQTPVHEVTLVPYFLSKFELTQGQWLRLSGSNPSYWHPDALLQGKRGREKDRAPITLAHPVEQISWFECRRYLSRAGLELPTEAQWEYACRAGTRDPWWCGKTANAILRKQAGNIAGKQDGYGTHAPVGSYSPNGFGLHDVIGNVFEWCRDSFGKYTLPTRDGDGERVSTSWNRVSRGGSCNKAARAARSANRMRGRPSDQFSALGCRPVRAHH